MTETTVVNQVELDAALTSGTSVIYIDSPAGVWLTLAASDSSRVEASDSSRVEAWGSSRVVARDSSRVVARDSSRVEAWGSSRVEARGSSSVVARGSSSVVAWDSSSVVAWDSSRVEARGSSSVEARDSSSVEAWGSSSVEARDSSSVVARDSSSVEAGTHVAVHLHSQRVTITGGVVIDMTTIDHTDPATWAGLHGATISRGSIVLFKATDETLTAGQAYTPVTYKIGETITAADWRDDNQCGGGLHLSPSPSCARQYRPDAKRYVAVRVKLADLRPISDGGAPKVKVRSCEVLHEVDVYGEALVTP